MDLRQSVRGFLLTVPAMRQPIERAHLVPLMAAEIGASPFVVGRLVTGFEQEVAALVIAGHIVTTRKPIFKPVRPSVLGELPKLRDKPPH